MSDPDVMADGDPVILSPLEKRVVVGAQIILRRAIGEMML